VDLRAYLDFLRRRWFLLLMGPLLAAMGGFLVFNTVTPVYRASSTVLVKPEISQNPAQPGDLLNFERFANTYAALMTSPSILEAVIGQEGLVLTVAELQGRVEARPVKDTELIEISVTDEDPATAADLANALPSVFIALNPGREATPGEVTIVRPARTGDPIAPGIIQTLMLAAAVGLMTSGLVCFALENLDDSVKSPAAIEAATGVAVVAEIGPVRFTTLPSLPRLPSVQITAALDHLALTILSKLGRPTETFPAVQAFMRSPSFEAFRHLRTAIDFSTAGSRLKLIAVTSPGPGEGKSTAAMNLCMALAQAGNRVILVDADLRRTSPDHSIHLADYFGITGLLLNHSYDPAIHAPTPALVPTDVENIELLPGGPVHHHPAELLSSPKMLRLLQALRKHADYVVIDTPPMLTASEAVWLSGKSDAVLLVVAEGRTRTEDVRQAVHLMQNVDAGLLGIIFNRPGSTRQSAMAEGMPSGSFETAREDSRAVAASPIRPARVVSRVVESSSPDGSSRGYVKGQVKQDGTTSVAN
jgi:polysaccharide biosynthesis transport protein